MTNASGEEVLVMIERSDLRLAESQTAEDQARLKAIFPAPRDSVAYILNAFSIVRRKDEERYDGDYRTKRVILEIYDAMQEAIRTGHPFQTRLDPLPADPSCCHPASQR
jgi:hypothetical protein